MATGFSVVNHFVSSFEIASNRRLPVMSRKGKITFNQRVLWLKERYGFTSDDMIGLIDFMYLHNPLGHDNLQAYGQTSTMYKVAPIYRDWRKQHRADVTKHGLRNTVYMLRPEETVTSIPADVADKLLAALRSAGAVA